MSADNNSNSNSNNEKSIYLNSEFLDTERTRTGGERELPKNPTKVMEILMQIHEAIIKQASMFYSSTYSEELLHSKVRVVNDKFEFDLLGECLYVRKVDDDDESAHKGSYKIQKLRQEQALAVLKVLEENINLELWGEKEKPTPELRRRYVLNSIIQAFRDRMDPEREEDRPEIEDAWFTLGLFLLDRVSGPEPLEYKNTLTPWVLPIIGEASKMILRGLDNTQRKVALCSSDNCYIDVFSDTSSFCDIKYLTETSNTRFQTIGRMGMFNGHREHSTRLFGNRKENLPTTRERDFFKVISCLPWDEGMNCFDPEPKEGINVLSTILDVLLDFRIFSEPLYMNTYGMDGSCTSISSSTYCEFIHIIDEIIKCHSEDDEETRDARYFVHEIICCLMVCVNQFWRIVKTDPRSWWNLARRIPWFTVSTRTEEMFRYLYDHMGDDEKKKQ